MINFMSKKDLDLDVCRCGHLRKDHDASENINYTDGECLNCDCIGFVITNDKK